MKYITTEELDLAIEEFDIYASESGADREVAFNYELSQDQWLEDRFGTNWTLILDD